MTRNHEPTVLELGAMPEHIAYEFNMLVETTARLELQALLDKATNNSDLESHLIHARNLLEFFFPRSERDGDVFAYDFVRGGKEEWSKLCPRTFAKELFGRDDDEVFKAISTRVGHIGTARLHPLGWSAGVIRKGMAQLLILFLEAVYDMTIRASIERQLSTAAQLALSEA